MTNESVRQLDRVNAVWSWYVSIILSIPNGPALLSEDPTSLETQLQIFNPERP